MDSSTMKRLDGLERQISMYERLFQSFSSKLDHHFKKYDMLISSQQQQINILTDTLSTMLNDQYRYSEILRDKLGTALSSVSATRVSMAGISSQRPVQQTQQQHQRRQHPAAASAASLSNVDAFLEDFIAPEVPMTNGSQSQNQNQHALPRRAKLGSFQTEQGGSLHSNTDEDTGYRPLEVDVPVSGLQGTSESVDSSQQRQMQVQIPVQGQIRGPVHGKRKYRSNEMSDGSASKKVTRSIPLHDAIPTEGTQVRSEETQSTQLAEEKYYTNRGQSKKRKVYTGTFKFFNSPQSIMDIWKEYTEGFEGQPSIKEMEQMYHVSWRREPAMNKRYHRRRVLCKAIEKGLEKGFHLDEILGMLEDARIANPERGTKHPISWICQFSHIPEILR